MKQKIIAAGGLVQNEKEEILMILRLGKWDLPKGKLDEGESIEHCALREVEEETGLHNVELRNLIGLTAHEYFDGHLQRNVIKETHWYNMYVEGVQHLTPQTEEDITDIKWIDKKDLPQYLQQSYATIVSIFKQAGF